MMSVRCIQLQDAKDTYRFENGNTFSTKSLIGEKNVVQWLQAILIAIQRDEKCFAISPNKPAALPTGRVIGGRKGNYFILQTYTHNIHWRPHWNTRSDSIFQFNQTFNRWPIGLKNGTK